MGLNICVYCSASNGIAAKYFGMAAEFGRQMAARGDTLIYGGASVGLMGEVARALHAGGGRVVGIIPQKLVDLEMAYQRADELIVTANIRERKAVMESRADAFVALPGGIGTLEEVFEIMTMKHLQMIDKPLVLLNLDGFYDPLVTLLDHMYQEAFLRSPARDYCAFVPDVAGVFAAIDSYRPASVSMPHSRSH